MFFAALYGHFDSFKPINRRLRKFSNDARDDTKEGKANTLKLRHWSKVPAKLPKKQDGEDENMTTSGKQTLCLPHSYTYAKL